MLSAMDDLPLHQASEPLRHVATSDRNFYDRYYFNLHGSDDGLFLIFGMGQYPNLGVQDAFAVARRGTAHRVLRASRPLSDRSDTAVGPFRIEVIEGLRTVRVVIEPNAHGIAMDVTWQGAIPAHLEPRHFVRRHGRVLFDSTRFAQTGFWSGTVEVDGESFDVTPDRWKGTRDRSWGIRPVGEPEPPGIRAGESMMGALWNYAPMQFDDFSILYIAQEEHDGTRTLEEAVRVWADPDRPVEHLGVPEHEHVFSADSKPLLQRVERSTLRFTGAGGRRLEVEVEPLIDCHLMVGTGYGLEQHWRHGMYQGPDLVVEGEALDVEADADRMFGLVDSLSRFTCGDDVGYGLHEYLVFGPHDRYGFG